ncbi:glycosyltransferase family 4 protein [Flavobacterium sp.]|uniref:glycosyltransferase family 4 protein n=1 Tax=Flavobacterium sp. TaxID=239 RepID=UPI0037C1B411
MKFLIVTHVVHTQKGNDFFAYSPYVNEMNVWLRHVDSVTIIAPLKAEELINLQGKYLSDNIHFIAVPQFSFINSKESIKALFSIPIIIWKLFGAMYSADHIHLRCPGNMGLLGSLVQLFFPFKFKSAKYAGNWDPKSRQPLSYELQKFILRNTFLTKRMQVLVYGEWKNFTKNCKSFFTATYSEKEIIPLQSKIWEDKIKFVFVGNLVKGKQPLKAIQIVENLIPHYPNVELSIYGDGPERKVLESYINKESLQMKVFFKGAQDKETLKQIYQNSHFLILFSKSEGWPKVVAESMFWGCLPIVSSVSCLPNMLDYEKRGIVLKDSFVENNKLINILIEDKSEYEKRSIAAASWSRNFTIEKFEEELIKILQSCE